MKTKQMSIVLCIGRYGGIERYADLVNKLNEGWVVNRVDYIYNSAGHPTRTIYILEKEFTDNGEQKR